MAPMLSVEVLSTALGGVPAALRALLGTSSMAPRSAALPAQCSPRTGMHRTPYEQTRFCNLPTAGGGAFDS